MGKTWRKKKQKGRKGNPHHQRMKAANVNRAKLQRALARERELVQEHLNQPKERKA